MLNLVFVCANWTCAVYGAFCRNKSWICVAKSWSTL